MNPSYRGSDSRSIASRGGRSVFSSNSRNGVIRYQGGGVGRSNARFSQQGGAGDYSDFDDSGDEDYGHFGGSGSRSVFSASGSLFSGASRGSRLTGGRGAPNPYGDYRFAPREPDYTEPPEIVEILRQYGCQEETGQVFWRMPQFWGRRQQFPILSSNGLGIGERSLHMRLLGGELHRDSPNFNPAVYQQVMRELRMLPQVLGPGLGPDR